MSANWRDGNSVELLINGDNFFPRLFKSIREAKHEVIIETFILRDDEVGRALQQTLIFAAKKGVRVHITIDDYGSSSLNEEFSIALANAGVKFHRFDPNPNFFGLRMNMFRRLHRKLAVIDGAEAFVGGINYCTDHLEKSRKAMQDYAVRLTGPVVTDIHQTCLNLLHNGTKKRKGQRPPVAKAQPKSGSVRALFTLRDNTRKHARDIEKHYLHAIRTARERIVIANAYFFPGYRLMRALRNAARRGVDVTLILQGQPDLPLVQLCTRLLYQYLLREGIVIHEYNQRAFHGKVALTDRKWSTLGSSNLEPLSLSLNLEANVIFEDDAFNRQLYAHLHSLTHDACVAITKEVAERGFWWKVPLFFLCFHFLRRFPAIAGWTPAHAPELTLVKPQH